MSDSLKFIFFSITISFVSSCVNNKLYLPPEPWERDILAQESMLIGGDPLEKAADDHIYFSKEGSSIGSSIGGGGCGCN